MRELVSKSIFLEAKESSKLSSYAHKNGVMPPFTNLCSPHVGRTIWPCEVRKEGVCCLLQETTAFIECDIPERTTDVDVHSLRETSISVSLESHKSDNKFLSTKHSIRIMVLAFTGFWVNN